MNIKVKDLAEMLKLSPSTISMVLNNRPGISKTTTDKVLTAIKELGGEDVSSGNPGENLLFVVYRKHGIASSASPYFSQLFLEIIEGVESQVKARGYNLMISYMDETSIMEEAEKIDKRKLKGVLVLATEMKEEQITIFEGLDIPLLIMDNYLHDKELNYITINNDKGVYEAIKHFYEMGHKSIGYLHIGDNANNFMERYYSFNREMERFHLNVNEENIIDISTEGGGEAVFRELKEKLTHIKNLPTAFFADNDIVAMYAMRVFKEMGLRLPEDISIIGFDNMNLSEMLDTPLTTIQVQKAKMGVVAANTIIDLREEIEGFVKIEVGIKLIIRNSVKNLNKSN